ncbi:ABC transporter substrate-binding protein [Loigolactobacillus binensis]|uniref:ABC transporter substrate-binding protein n=1 Tax=Loigolactobacillus binensis TaxID=2559922 RepID=A0ABW3E7X5_9LACO|nr:ABC transporter substrate-binding protein [Loigolactobacillus binensis]
MKKWVKSLITLLAIVTLVVPLAGCGSGNKSSAKSQSTTTSKTITDEAGDKVQIPKKVNRIAVLVLPLPSFLAVFFNATKKIVTMPQPSMAAAKNSLLSELYPDILKVNTKYNKGTDINIEELKKSKPDVVLYNADDTHMKKKLLNAGFTAVGFSMSNWHYNAMETQKHWIALLSKMFPENNKVKLVDDYSDKITNLVQKRVKKISPAQRQKVLFLFQYDNSMIVTSGKDNWGQYWADASGAINVSKGLKGAATVNMEQIYKWNPQRIFITNFTTAQPADLYNNTIGNYDWSKVAAVKNKKVSKMPLGMYRGYTPGADTPVTLLWMAKTVYPDQFKDINILKETKAYYKKVFNVTLTDQQAEKIFKAPSAASAY